MVDGPRYLILGVRDNGPAERVLVGIANDEIASAEACYEEEIERYIEPVLPIELHSLELDGSMLLMLALNHCSEPPIC